MGIKKLVKVKLFHSAVVALGYKAVSSIVGYGMFVYVAKMMSPDTAGVFFLCFNIAALFGIISSLGLETLLIKLVSQNRLGDRKYILRAYSNAIAGSVLVSGIVLVIIVSYFVIGKLFQIPYYEFDIIVLSLVSILFIGIFRINAGALQGAGKFGMAILIFFGIMPALIIVLTYLSNKVVDSETVAAIPLIIVASSVSTAIISIILSLKAGLYLKLETVSKNYLKHLWRDSHPLLTVNIMIYFTTWSSQMISAIWISPSEVALLTVANSTALLVSFFLAAANRVLAQEFAVLHVDGQLEKLRILYVNVIRIMFVIAIIVFGLVVLFSTNILSLFGEHYVGAERILFILLVGQVFNAVCGPVGILLSMTGHQKDYRDMVIVSAIISVILTILLTTGFGVIGASIATTISIVVQNSIGIAKIKKKLGVKIFFNEKYS